MGYNTYFVVTVTDDNRNTESQGSLFNEEELNEIDKALDLEERRGNEFGGTSKWYDWEKDLRNLSKKYPNLFFEVEGMGEENGDLWKAWFKAGKAQIEQAVITYGKFNEEKMT
ncbi:MAG: hypothetical protein HC880_05130 [Bacteroidia bacterium]|nr:hypothetical protein [Bacteroidia bacterium]